MDKTMELPEFVKLKNTALRLRGNEYYRDGGDWSTSYKIINGELLSWFPSKPRLHRIPLIKITISEWRKDNGKYAPKHIR